MGFYVMDVVYPLRMPFLKNVDLTQKYDQVRQSQLGVLCPSVEVDSYEQTYLSFCVLECIHAAFHLEMSADGWCECS